MKMELACVYGWGRPKVATQRQYTTEIRNFRDSRRRRIYD